MDRIIFGDNQFFGVDHLSEENAKRKEARFSDDKEIFRVLDIAHEAGIRTFMCTTYKRIETICNYFEKNKKYQDWKIYPCMPYAHKYANALTEYGFLGTIDLFAGGNVLKSTLVNTGAVFRRDAFQIMKTLVDAEMNMFKRVNTNIIFLQNVVTDLCLGLGMYDFLYEYCKYIRNTYHSEPGFITMNLAKTNDDLVSLGEKNPIICASINKIGFRMKSDQRDFQILENKSSKIIAMQALAAGALDPGEAFRYVTNFDGVKSILFGASSKDHINQSVNLINSFDKRK